MVKKKKRKKNFVVTELFFSVFLPDLSAKVEKKMITNAFILDIPKHTPLSSRVLFLHQFSVGIHISSFLIKRKYQLPKSFIMAARNESRDLI